MSDVIYEQPPKLTTGQAGVECWYHLWRFFFTVHVYLDACGGVVLISFSMSIIFAAAAAAAVVVVVLGSSSRRHWGGKPDASVR